MVSKLREIKIFTGTAHPLFAERVCESLGTKLAAARLFRFSDGEIGVSIEESVRGADVYIIQPTCHPVNENLMELLIMIDVLRRASAYRINVVTPYFGYARQDRKTKAREPITAKLVANLIEKAGADRLIAADLHAGQIQGFFDIPVDHLTGVPLLASYFKQHLKDELEEDKIVVVSPDIGGVVRARRFAVHLNADLAIVDKRRSHEVANLSEVMEIIGNVQGKTAILVDDIIDTAGTVVQAAEALLERGASRVFACATHGVLSGPAVDRIKKSPIEKLVLTDTVNIPEEKHLDNIKELSIAPLFAEAISRIHSDHSVSILFR
ncbi:ribose-phosphate pyrophosphokinase [Thermovirga lienii DSM 17291]|jgi:ribose-phosphate pyrophosphokinase|uniref:Ribose-phosphate pyrophosphokinase n=1 Tax=Thermovirga lienii (strain ATCC BAA-1197 / DSM 17291 / Cas60314) TaxID=580340 RepID=G7V9F1_THELD|nr:ribose-phosphate pyrophosphokinase [Thermovirga lienii]AER66501.1 ribose-phosphate pyrophosphokinase [Thermovirga lienii DSM 17291]MDN5318707.1 ribose-phosphate pyrophosphokinae [Thermovirga sp.]MDN5367449.1 ribose-phosphate pyrophosphokinae [Thermovirga sp.]